MPDLNKHLIIYSSENQPVAEQMASLLQNAGKEAMILERSATDMTEQVGQIKVPSDSSVTLLVTDNFLKSYGCMNGILQMAYQWGNEEILNTVVTQGAATNEDGQQETVPTNFERVGDIIQYMNFWQDKYLALRKEKRTRSDDEELEEQIAVTKEISADIGEFLRYIRGKGFYSIEEFGEKYGAVEEDENKIDELPDGATILESHAYVAEPPLSQADGQSLVEMIENSSEEIMAENPDISQKGMDEEKTEEEIAESAITNKPINEVADKNEIADTPPPSLENLIDTANGKDDSKDYDPFEEDEPPADFSKKEIDAINEENEELMAILDEVLLEEGIAEKENKENYQFIGDDPDNPSNFNIDSLIDNNDKKAASSQPVEETIEDDVPVGENEVLLNIQAGDEDGISSEEIMERAVGYFGENQIQEGLSYMTEVLKKRPSDTTLRYYFAYALARYAADYKTSKEQLHILLEQDSEHPDAWFLKAELAENQQDFEEAKTCFEKVIEIQPTYPEVHYRLGILLADFMPGAEEESAARLKEAILQDDENTDAYYMLATLLSEKLDQPENSVKHFRQVVRLQPNHPFANYDLALTYHMLGDKIRALEFYNRAVSVNPELKTEQNDLAFGIEENEEEKSEEVVEATANEIVEKEDSSEPEIEEDLLEDLIENEPIEPVNLTPAPNLDVELAPQSIETIDNGNGNGFHAQLKPTEESQQNSIEKTVLITGATAGIGKATAEVFARNGYKVIVTGRRQERLNEISEILYEEYDVPVLPLAFDVRDQEAVNAVFNGLAEEWKNIDILINNAGLSRGLQPIHEGSTEDWDTMIDTNVKGLLYITKVISPSMVKRKSGHIINVSSIAGTEVYPGGNVYSASKAAVSSLTRSMRLDLHKYNIRVSQVSPGHVEETEFARVRFDWDTEKANKVYENFQPLKSSDVAETIYFIATRPTHVNIQDIYMYGTQQASATMIERSGR